MKELKTVDIKGKSYVMVNERIAYFREIYPEGSIITELLSSIDGVHTIKATAINNGNILATGHASEKDGSSFINKTSALENAETSAVGRCLGILGIGIDAAVASAEEVGNAVKQQENKSPTVDAKKLRLHLEDIAIAPDIDSLRLANVQAYKFAEGDQDALSAILKAKNARKKELTENE
jgi:hypothetical protein|tara:strand:+ start:375 stop:911 length:537 start_codon:yes stop_codon:yes gene_type:complete